MNTRHPARTILSELLLQQDSSRVGSAAPVGLLRRFLSDVGSTTAFLEDLLGEELRVEVLGHKERSGASGPCLERESILRGPRSSPLVASHCILNLAAWSDKDADLLRAGEVPIGRILKMQSGSGLIKDRISIERGGRHRLVGLLSVADTDRAFLKHYRLRRGDKCIGEFTEAASEASLRRAVSRSCSV